jgi:glycosyltransferase involved in cell wall biosynthesis
MKITFVIPAFNEEKYIRPCLESIMREIHVSGFDAEVIAVNNASTDGTKAVALSVPGVRVIDENRKGVVRARQAGFRAATGDLIANIDADVMVPEGWLVKVVGEFERDENLVAVSGPYIYYDAPPYQKILISLFYSFSLILYHIGYSLFRVGAMAQGGNFVIRKSALQKINGYDTSIDFYGDDTDAAQSLSAVGKVKWSGKIAVLSSSRRLEGEGIFRMGIRYAMNYFWVTCMGRPFTKEHKDIRS